MKKTYLEPSIELVQVWTENIVCDGVVSTVGGNAVVGYGGGGSGPARAPESGGGIWDDEDYWHQDSEQ